MSALGVEHLLLLVSCDDCTELCWCFVNWWVTVDRWAKASTDEDNLISYLFDQQDYNPLIRPVQNRSETLEVGFEMALIQLIALVRRKHTACLLPGTSAGGEVQGSGPPQQDPEQDNPWDWRKSELFWIYKREGAEGGRVASVNRQPLDLDPQLWKPDAAPACYCAIRPTWPNLRA